MVEALAAHAREATARREALTVAEIKARPALKFTGLTQNLGQL